MTEPHGLEPLLKKLGRHEVPGLWAKVLPEDFFYLQYPDESGSSCDNCPQVVRAGFKMPYKCCTYIPRIPNFLMGAGLKSKEHRAAMLRGVELYGLPEGSLITPALYRESLLENSKGLFGKTSKVLCPFLDTDKKQCGIYPFRNSVCSTFFCLNNHGTRGHMFWEKVQNFVGQVETAVSHWCMEQLGLSVDNFLDQLNYLSQDLDKLSHPEGGWSKEVKSLVFGDWSKDIVGFFEACHELVENYEGDVYEVASKVQLQDAWQYNRAIYEWVPEEAQKEFEKEPPEAQGALIPIQDLWYELQLFHRGLWHLPFNEARLVVNPHVSLEENEQGCGVEKYYGTRPFLLKRSCQVSKKLDPWRKFLSEEEKTVFESFREPRVLNSELLECGLIQAVGEPRRVLSEWLRDKVLVEESI